MSYREYKAGDRGRTPGRAAGQAGKKPGFGTETKGGRRAGKGAGYKPEMKAGRKAGNGAGYQTEAKGW